MTRASFTYNRNVRQSPRLVRSSRFLQRTDMQSATCTCRNAVARTCLNLEPRLKLFTRNASSELISRIDRSRIEIFMNFSAQKIPFKCRSVLRNVISGGSGGFALSAVRTRVTSPVTFVRPKFVQRKDQQHPLAQRRRYPRDISGGTNPRGRDYYVHRGKIARGEGGI